MKSAIIGLPAVGKQTVFEALSAIPVDPSQKHQDQIATVTVPDARIDVLSSMYRPKKTIFAKVEYLLPAKAEYGQEAGSDQGFWTKVRDADALIPVLRNFQAMGGEAPQPEKDYLLLEQEMMLSDLIVVEKRLERLILDQKRGKKTNPEEMSLLKRCRQHLETEEPLRAIAELADAKLLRGYAFLSAKPLLALFNNGDDDETLPRARKPGLKEDAMVIRGKLELELSQMSAEEAGEFLTEYNISTPARDRVIRRSYDLLGLISFFTVGDDEVRAWTVRENTPALDAAGAIHSDIKQGFIRAEVIAYDDLMKSGSYAEARKRGTVRLEGKTYPVKDGDIINFRFNV